MLSSSLAGPALAWLVEEMRSYNATMKATTEQMEELGRRMAVLEGTERGSGPAGEIEDLRRRLTWLAGEVQARGDVLTRAADEVDRLGTEMSVMRSQANDLAKIQVRVRQIEVAQGPVALRHELDRVAAEVVGIPDFAELGRAALRTMELDGAMVALRQEVENITRGLGSLGQSAMAQVAGRTAPLEGAIHELREELTTKAEDLTAARAEGDAQLAEVVSELVARIAAVESIPPDVESVRLDLEGLQARFEKTTEASAESAREKLDDIEARLSALAALAADIEGFYSELDRAREKIRVFETSMGTLAERTAPLELGIDELRQRFDQLDAEVFPAHQLAVADIGDRVRMLADRVGSLGLVAEEVADLQVTLGAVGEESKSAHQAALATATEQLAIAVRLRDLDAVPAELRGIQQALEKAASDASLIRESVLGAVLERMAPVERGVEQLRFDLDAMTEAVSGQIGLVGERVSALEPAVVQSSMDVGALEPVVTQAVGEIERVSSTTRDALSAMTAEMQELHRELGRVAAQAQRMETLEPAIERVTAQAQRMEVLEPAVDQIRSDFDRVSDAMRVALATMETDFEGVHRELDRVSAQTTGLNDELLEEVAAKVAPVVADIERVSHATRDALAGLESDIQGVHQELERVSAQSQRVDGLEPAIEQVRADIDRFAEEMRVALATMETDVQGVHRKVDRVSLQAAGLTGVNDELLEEVAAKVAPVMADIERVSHATRDALAGLEADMEGVHRELDRVSAQAQKIDELEPAVERVTAQSQRIEVLEPAVDQIRSDFDRVANATRDALAGMETDFEGVHRELDRVSAQAQRIDELEPAIERVSAQAQRIEELEPAIERVSAQVQRIDELGPAVDQIRSDFDRMTNATRDALAGMESDFEGVHRELDRVSVEAERIRESILEDVAARVAPVATEVERVAASTEEGMNGLQARIGELSALEPRMAQAVDDIERVSVATRDALAGLETDMQAVHRELDRVSSQAQRMDALEPSIEQVRSDFDRVAEAMRVALVTMETDFEGVHRELDRVSVEAERIRESILEDVSGRVAPVAAEVERVAASTHGSLSGLQARVGELESLEPVVVQVAGDIERVSNATRDALVGMETDMQGVRQRLEQVSSQAQRMDTLEPALEQLHAELDRVSSQTESMGEALRAEIEGRVTPMSADIDRVAITTRDGLAGLESRLQDLAVLSGQVSTLTGDVEGIYREVAQLSMAVESTQSGVGPQVAQEIAAVSARLDTLAAMAGELDRARQAGQATAEQVESLGVATAAIRDVVGSLRSDIERIDGSVSADRSLLNTKMAELETLPSEVSSLYREIGRIEDAAAEQERRLAPVLALVPELQDTVGALTKRMGSLSDDSLRSRIHEVTDPTEELVAQMAARVEAVMSELKAARAEAAAILGQSTPLTESIDALRADVERLRGLEAVPGRMQEVARDVDATVRRMGDRQEAELAAASAAVQALEGRLAAIEAIPADMDGLYAALYGVAASLKDLGAEVPDSMPVAPKLVGTRRVPTRKPRSDQ